jgi:hypothetical protein
MADTILNQVSLSSEQRNLLTEVLGQVMSDCSQSCWHAGWLLDTEKEVPILVERVVKTQQPEDWGHGVIDLPTAMTLKGLSLLLGHWAAYDAEKDRYIAYTPKE